MLLRLTYSTTFWLARLDNHAIIIIQMTLTWLYCWLCRWESSQFILTIPIKELRVWKWRNSGLNLRLMKACGIQNKDPNVWSLSLQFILCLFALGEGREKKNSKARERERKGKKKMIPCLVVGWKREERNIFPHVWFGKGKGNNYLNFYVHRNNLTFFLLCKEKWGAYEDNVRQTMSNFKTK